jgi:hypothetical protein
MPKRATVWIEKGWINIRADFDSSLAPTLKAEIQPPSHRRWDDHADGSACPKGSRAGFNSGRCGCKGHGWWLVEPSHLDEVIPLLEALYDVTVLAPEAPPAPQRLLTSGGGCLCSMASPDTLKQIYRLVALEAHPDKGGSTERMSEVNAMWMKMKKGKGV